MKNKLLGANENKSSSKRISSKMQWVVLVVLVIGFLSFIFANNDTFRLFAPSTAYNACGSSALQYEASVNSSRCRTLTREQQDEMRWRDILEASPAVMAASGIVIALSLIVLTWQISKLVKTLNKKQ